MKATVARIIAGDAATLVRHDHGDWYRELSQPGVAAGVVLDRALMGIPEALRLSARLAPRPAALGSRA